MKCKDCKDCLVKGRSNHIKNLWGRKHYFCMNKKVLNMKDKWGRPVYNFCGYGDNSYESPLQLKTTPRFCPIKNK